MLRGLSIILTGILIINILIIAEAQNDSPDKKEMPLTIIPAEGIIKGPAFFLISGDGGWTSFDNSFCEALAKKGIPVVGLDAKKYFWKAKTPEETTAALAPVIEQYTKQWNRSGFVLAGYSFGADVVPFIAGRLPDPIKGKAKLILLLSPDRYGDFEIHLTDMLSLGIAKKRYNIVNEVKNIKEFHAAAIFGQNEEDINIQAFKETGIKVYLLPGDHHYNKNVSGLTDMIIKAISE
jgi:type IV secretory pathway VirJ component